MYIKVYCILAHKNPEQIEALINLLNDGKSLFFIHLDKKINIKDFKKLLLNSSCHFVKNRVSCSWGKYSLVQATINVMKEVKDFMHFNNKDSEFHFIMLSGEDLPLKKNKFVHDFLESNKDKSFLNYWKLPYEKWWDGGLFRLGNLFCFQYKKYSKLNYCLNRTIKRLNCHFLLPLNQLNKRFPSFKIYGSSQWMILNKELLEFVLKINAENPKFNSVFKYVLAPDELYFGTLIMNYKIKNQFLIDNDATHLVKFEGHEASPVYLQITDLNDNNEKTLFARKFDSQINQNTIDFIIMKISQ